VPRYYKVRLPRRVASEAAAKKSKQLEPHFEDFEDPGVTFLVSDIERGKIPTTSTVDDGRPRGGDVGLNSSEIAEVMASMAAAERAMQPDRLPLVIALVAVGLVLLLSSGVVQTFLRDTREHMVEERIKRPRARYGWMDRVGATKKSLGLPDVPAEKIDYVRPRQRFFPAIN
jgi:hypothetical protein